MKGEVETEKPGGRKNREDEVKQDQYLHGTKLVILTMTLMLGQFLTGIDNTVITTAIPRITDGFHSLNDVGWYGSSYLLTSMALQPTFGKVYAYFNIKWTFAMSIFIAGRAVAGVGQAALLSGGMTVIGYCVPLEKRAIYFAILSSMNGIASVIGPLLGGVFTDSARLTWRFCFWINVRAIVIILGLFSFKSPVQPPVMKLKDKLAKLDLVGAILFITGMTCLFMTLQRGGAQYPWSNIQAWGWLLGFGFAMILFVILQLRLGDDATIPPRIIGQKSIAFCCLFVCFISIGLSTHTYFLPFYFQSAKGVSAESSGIDLVPYLASLMVMALVVGALMIAVGYCVPFMWFGSVVFAIASGLLTTLKVNSSTATWAGFQVLAGSGYGSTLTLAAVAIQAALPDKDLPTGNALMLFNNFLGMALAVSIAQNVFSNVLEHQLEQIVPQLNTAAIISAGATAISTVVPPTQIDTVREAYNYALSKVFIAPIAGAVVAFVCTFGIKWQNIRKKKEDDTSTMPEP
ncbi:hypothetical protein MMC17_005593 [Xylographa soralifera]|nr:hypothetical protein [Xylographa soralifera]